MINLFERALSRAREALELPPERPIEDLSLSVFLKYLLVARLEQMELSIDAFRRLPPHERRASFPKLAATAGNMTAPVVAEAVHIIRNDSRFTISPGILESCPHAERYLGRVAQLAVEQFTSERLAPELCIAPKPLSPSETPAAPPAPVDLAVLFTSFPNFSNELYPLVIDALDSSCTRPGEPGVNVLGVHTKWWRDDGAICRGIFLRRTDHVLIESDLAEPNIPAAILSLCMSAGDHAGVSEKAARLRIEEINRYTPFAQTADDKFECFRRWSEAGVPTPPVLLVPAGTPARKAVDMLRRSIEDWDAGGRTTDIVVQPNHGTEGRNVACFPDASDSKPILDHIADIFEDDDAIVRPLIAGLLFGGEGYDATGAFRTNDSPSGEMRPRACDLRLNVTCDGNEWRAESGYLQVAGRPGDPISSIERGGCIVSFSRGALDHLLAPSGEGYVGSDISQDSTERIRDIAVRAAGALGESGLVGIDLRLLPPSCPSGEIGAVVLDANPRPAGLSHSEFLPEPGAPPEPGVSRGMWKRFGARRG